MPDRGGTRALPPARLPYIPLVLEGETGEALRYPVQVSRSHLDLSSFLPERRGAQSPTTRFQAVREERNQLHERAVDAQNYSSDFEIA